MQGEGQDDDDDDDDDDAKATSDNVEALTDGKNLKAFIFQVLSFTLPYSNRFMCVFCLDQVF